MARTQGASVGGLCCDAINRGASPTAAALGLESTLRPLGRPKESTAPKPKK